MWDAQGSDLLLVSEEIAKAVHMDFSSDGQFFACVVDYEGIFIWRESPTGYTLHQKLTFTTSGYFRSFFSPNGESVIVCTPWGIQLYTTSSFSDMSIQCTSQYNFIFALPPDKSFAAVAYPCEEKITVLNPKGSEHQLSITAGMEVLCLGVTGRTVVAVGEGKICSWNVPAGTCGPNAGANINNNVQTTTVNYPEPSLYFAPSPRISISCNCNYIACIVGKERPWALNIYGVYWKAPHRHNTRWDGRILTSVVYSG